jgi:4-hydroxyphenylpyruvate dioxygenase-like putative hemolysin
MVIEKGIQIPKVTRPGKYDDIILEMEAFDSVHFTDEKTAKSFSANIRKLGFSCSMRMHDGGWRVWKQTKKLPRKSVA